MLRSARFSTALVAATLFAAPAAADIGDNDLGVNTHVPANDLLDMCVDLGVSWIRVDANWWSMNPSSGTYDWTVMDRVVDEASSRGLSVYMTLAYTPDWVPRVSRTRTDGYGGNDEPAGSSEWVAFVEAAVGRYADRGVTHYGIWNEPNLDHFWEADADAYVDKILVPGADAVRRTCSSCFVLGPDLAHVGDYDAFLDRVLTRAPGAFDILAHHIYQGWPETGTAVWDGDRFLEALEMRRFTFTRASLREVLDDHGYTGEVWITETGYEAEAIGDAGDEMTQATYVRRVMEEQLARPWWTNTFFYEITDCGVDQPGCDIDGFGITRPDRPVSAGGPRSFPDDYRLKPAYTTIRDFIDDHPEIAGSGSATVPACANGEDDDGDGHVDSEDRGCANGTDDDESDDPPRRTLEALPAGALTVDGDLSDWGTLGSIALRDVDWVGVVPYGGATDLYATVDARWTSDAIWLAVEVTDDAHVATDPDDRLYLGDSVQLAFDVDADRACCGYDADDHELNFALRDGTTVASHRFHGAGSDEWEVAITRDGNQTTYELRLPRAVLGDPTLADGTELGFSILVNDDDGASTDDGTGREGWVELSPGIGRGKNPYAFGTLALVIETTPDGGVPGSDAGTGGDDASAPSADGSAPGVDAGTDGPPAEEMGDCTCGAAGPTREAPWIALVLLGLGLAARIRARR